MDAKGKGKDISSHSHVEIVESTDETSRERGREKVSLGLIRPLDIRVQSRYS